MGGQTSPTSGSRNNKALGAGIAAGGEGIAAAFSGGTKLNLTPIPPPGNQYPGVANDYQTFLRTYSSQAGTTMGDMMKTGMPTNVGPAYEAMVAAHQRQTNQGEQNLLESFGQMGLRHSSNAMSADVDYQSQVSKDFASILADYTRQSSEAAAGRQLSSSEFFSTLFQDAGRATYPTVAGVTGPSTGAQVGAAAGSAMQTIGLMIALGMV